MAVLVNSKTASAAEIVAACLQDHHRAVVVGERTFGQGTVRTIVQLKSGMGALKPPVAACYRPSGKNVNRYPNSTDLDEWGISPDAGGEVALPEEEMKAIELNRASENPKAEVPDRQLQRAVECLVAELEKR